MTDSTPEATEESPAIRALRAEFAELDVRLDEATAELREAINAVKLAADRRRELHLVTDSIVYHRLRIIDALREAAPLTLDEEKIAADLLDSVPPPTCVFEISTSADRCGAPATDGLCLSCGHVLTFCAEHRDAMERWFAPRAKDRAIVCSMSGHDAKLRVTYEWRAL